MRSLAYKLLANVLGLHKQHWAGKKPTRWSVKPPQMLILLAVYERMQKELSD